MTGHTKEPWSFVIDADWPFDLKLVCGGKTLFHQPRVAYSTKAKTLADVRSAVGFGSSERAEVVALIADQEALFERTADLWNALATIPDPSAYIAAARGMREALEAQTTRLMIARGVIKQAKVMWMGDDEASVVQQKARAALRAFDAAQGEQW